MPHGKTYRQIAADIIAGLKIEQFDPNTKSKLDAAYPFGTRELYPYRVWLQVCRRLCWWSFPTREKPFPTGLFADRPDQ